MNIVREGNFLFDTDQRSSAVFSDDKKYRYMLYRMWSASKPTAMLIGLNPSTANEFTDDPTIRRITGLLKKLDYGAFYMTNLFAYVTPYPEELQNCDDPLGENDEHLQFISKKSDQIIFCWGNFFVYGRDEDIKKMFPHAKCFGKNRNGSPKHPLYLRTGTQLIDF